MNRDRLLVLITAPAIAFAFVVGAAGFHRWYGIARVAITLIVVIWIAAHDAARREWLPRATRRVQGLLRLGATALVAVEVARVCVVMAKQGFTVGDLIAALIDLVVFGYLLQGALVALGRTPGQALYDAAVRAQATDRAKALKLATRATKLYRKWDDAWVLRAGIAGGENQVAILKQGLRYCPRSKEINDLLISSLYASGARDEAEAMLAGYREMFPRSARPVLIDAANAIDAGDWSSARAFLDEAIKRARKERDGDALAKIERVAALLPEGR
ncbi:MAG TPA: hypothetical protein VJ818_01755 [Actinomycetota bacterium]|nr:hypothetical protein [Actinomycetota bacterium]